MQRAETAPPVDSSKVVPLFAALADPTRLRLLLRLADGERRSISDLCAGIPMSRQAVSKHLGVLNGAGLVRDESRGREHLWEIEPGGIESARVYLEAVEDRWRSALSRLKRFVEDDATPAS